MRFAIRRVWPSRVANTMAAFMLDMSIADATYMPGTLPGIR